MDWNLGEYHFKIDRNELTTSLIEHNLGKIYSDHSKILFKLDQNNLSYNIIIRAEEDMIRMLEFLVDNIFMVFAGKVFQQIIGIPMGTSCAPLLADIFLYSYEAEFIQSLLSTGRKRLASQFNFTYRYIDDVLSINNPDFEN